jgi:hypothetical protein
VVRISKLLTNHTLKDSVLFVVPSKGFFVASGVRFSVPSPLKFNLDSPSSTLSSFGSELAWPNQFPSETVPLFSEEITPITFMQGCSVLLNETHLSQYSNFL